MAARRAAGQSAPTVVGIGFSLLNHQSNPDETFQQRGMLRLYDLSGVYTPQQIDAVREEQHPTGDELAAGVGGGRNTMRPFYADPDVEFPSDDWTRGGAVFCPAPDHAPGYYHLGDNTTEVAVDILSNLGSLDAKNIPDYPVPYATHFNTYYVGTSRIKKEKYPFSMRLHGFELYLPQHVHNLTRLCIVPESTGMNLALTARFLESFAVSSSTVYSMTQSKCLLPCRPHNPQSSNNTGAIPGHQDYYRAMYRTGNNDLSFCNDLAACSEEHKFDTVTFFVVSDSSETNSFMRVLFPVTLTTITFVMGMYFGDVSDATSKAVGASTAIAGVILQYIAMVSTLPFYNVYTLAHMYYIICMTYTSAIFVWILVAGGMYESHHLEEDSPGIIIWQRHITVLWKISMALMCIFLCISLSVCVLVGRYYQYAGWIATAVCAVAWVAAMLIVDHHTAEIDYYLSYKFTRACLHGGDHVPYPVRVLRRSHKQSQAWGGNCDLSSLMQQEMDEIIQSEGLTHVVKRHKTPKDECKDLKDNM
eukprot:jgi/Tetstr1/448698/TSEL_035937.t1